MVLSQGWFFYFFPAQGTLGNAWKHFQLLKLEGGDSYYWHLVSSSQGCCSYPIMHKRAPQNKELSASKCQWCWGWKTLFQKVGDFYEFQSLPIALDETKSLNWLVFTSESTPSVSSFPLPAYLVNL